METSMGLLDGTFWGGSSKESWRFDGVLYQLKFGTELACKKNLQKTISHHDSYGPVYFPRTFSKEMGLCTEKSRTDHHSLILTLGYQKKVGFWVDDTFSVEHACDVFYDQLALPWFQVWTKILFLVSFVTDCTADFPSGLSTNLSDDLRAIRESSGNSCIGALIAPKGYFGHSIPHFTLFQACPSFSECSEADSG